MIDTAAQYNNEAEVGDGIRFSGVSRSSVFLITKVWVDSIDNEAIQQSLDDSLRQLRLDYVDLFLLHTPSRSGVPLETSLYELQQLQVAGKVKHIGVSNFRQSLMEQAAAKASTIGCIVSANQVECHPYLPEEKLTVRAKQLGIIVIAHTPLARGRVLAEPSLLAIAKRHSVGVGQLVMRWLIDRGNTLVIPGSGNPQHIVDNSRCADFELTSAERFAIAQLSASHRLVTLPWIAWND